MGSCVSNDESILQRQLRAKSVRESPSWRSVIVELRLSRREVEIVECLLDLDDDEMSIAGRLGISKSTVHTHLERLYRKLRVSSRCQLVASIFATYVASDSTAMRAEGAGAAKTGALRRAVG